ncbi:hypothetical protein [Streptomyces sp. NPDC059828]|uniref:DUF7847 domain-containing protein n=1 Tax=Streptomyces sp. NPDC059828 TaxID=3346965 RepID=UPI00364B16FF
MGDLFNGAFSTVGRHWKQLFGMALAVYGAATLLVVAAFAIAYSAVERELRVLLDTSHDSPPSWDEGGPLLTAFVCVWLIAVLAMLLSTVVVQTSIAVVVQDAVLGRPTTIGAVWRRTAPRVPAVLGALLISSLIVVVPVALALLGFVSAIVVLATQDDAPAAGGLALLGFLGTMVTTPLAVWLWVRFSLAPAAVVFEGQGPVKALRRSSVLVRGEWWRVFGISLLAYMGAATVGSMVQYFTQLLGMFPTMLMSPSSYGPEPDIAEIFAGLGVAMVISMVGGLISQIITTTFPSLVTCLLYVDERLRKENLGPVLAEAAGMQQPPAPPASYGPAAPGEPPVSP